MLAILLAINLQVNQTEVNFRKQKLTLLHIRFLRLFKYVVLNAKHSQNIQTQPNKETKDTRVFYNLEFMQKIIAYQILMI